jgi:hypothetical protein
VLADDRTTTDFVDLGHVCLMGMALSCNCLMYVLKDALRPDAISTQNK